MTLHHVVVGVDGSLVSVRALDWAADEAARRGTELRVVYAVPDSDEAGPVLASAVTRLTARHPELSVVTTGAVGGPVRTLVRESEGADLTVVGTRGMGGIAGLLFGSVSLRLAAQVRSPLLVVRGDHRCDDGRPVLLGLEGDGDEDAALYAFQEAERRGVPLHVLHSWTHRHVTPELPSLLPAMSPGQEQLAQRARVEDSVPRFSLARLSERHPAIQVESRTVRTGPAPALLEATRDCALVVVGAHHRTHRFGPRLGPVAHTLLHRSHCPVAVVPIAK
ncbi:Nucleotide-binding universal stress protein, UspA family [Streptomyces sp. 3213]|uniref:universal stress protein n=1 Tax=Streptomyces sp. 3213.3 TaxID=1855348 RepID=UPI00089C7B44|nr:universal stress protein [Streptomyces sp. 3213.3]SEC76128.1 Nucleotide-binding universal stress protein, UspA family [Streptomyces sp. 3213] [Streptomyces sp. 3213.3]